MMVVGFPSTIDSSRPRFYTALEAPEVHSGSYSIPAATVFSFGILVIEVRSSCLATYSVGEMDDLSSAQGFCRRVSVGYNR